MKTHTIESLMLELERLRQRFGNQLPIKAEVVGFRDPDEATATFDKFSFQLDVTEADPAKHYAVIRVGE